MRNSIPLSLILALTACTAPQLPRIDRTQAIELLNSGQVARIAVSHSGWTALTLQDGSTVIGKAKSIGYPKQLLSNCSDCQNVSVWIE